MGIPVLLRWTGGVFDPRGCESEIPKIEIELGYDDRHGGGVFVPLPSSGTKSRNSSGIDSKNRSVLAAAQAYFAGGPNVKSEEFIPGEASVLMTPSILDLIEFFLGESLFAFAHVDKAPP